MTEASVNYMGIKLANPIIIGSSNMVDDPEFLKKLEDAGAAAIVFKSLFEEQIQLESLQFHTEMELYNERSAESINLYPDMQHAGPAEHLYKLALARKKLLFPLSEALIVSLQKHGLNGQK